MALARGIRLSGLIEFLVYGLFYTWIWSPPGRSLIGFVTFAVVAFLAVRLLATCVSFILALMHRSPPPKDLRLDSLQWARLVLREYWATLLCYGLLQPWVGRFGPPAPTRTGTDTGAPVILVHGFFCNAAYWWGLRRALQAAGIESIYTLSLEPVYNDIDVFGRQLAERIQQVLSETGAAQVLLIGHSMGGLVSRAAVLRHGQAEHVAGIVTLGTPHFGTALAMPWSGLNVRQMADHSDWLTELSRQDDSAAPVPVTSIFSYHDNIVAPQENAILPRAENHAVGGVGHMSLAFDRGIQQRVIRALRGYRRSCATRSGHA
jgi:triacylglycerol esterase/lipase EstA (alpha/beta hydrolase family)